MEIIISSVNLIETIKIIAGNFKTGCETDCEEKMVKIPATFGNGTIKGINLRNGLGLFLLDFTLKEELILHYQLKVLQPLRAIFCQAGKFNYIFEGHQLQYSMQPLSSSITASSDHKNQLLKFPAKKRITLSVLEIDRKEYIKNMECDLDSVPQPLADVFRNYSAEAPFLYQGDYSLSVSEVVNEIHSNHTTGLVRKAFLESKSLELLSLIINQYQDDLNPNVKKVIIRKADLEKIELAKEVLTLDLSNPITIPELAKKVGLNENKLKRSFKQAFGSTVNQYIIRKRLEYSKVLLISGSFSIQEVAEKVGYKNVSFFTRKFKEKFGMLPKDFVKTNKVALSA